MSATVTVDKVQRARLKKKMHKMMANVADWKPFWPVAQSIMHASIVYNFRAGGRPKKWPALSPWTQAVRAAKGAASGSALGRDVLLDSGGLFQSIGNVHVEHKRSFRYGTNLNYARMMHFGTQGLPGGVLRPVSAEHLALPFPGVRGRPADYENTFVTTTKTGKIIWQRNDAGGARALFLLKKSVKIPPRPFMMFQDEDVTRISGYALAYAMGDKRFTG